MAMAEEEGARVGRAHVDHVEVITKDSSIS